MSPEKLLKELNKIIPFQKIKPYLIFIGVIGIMMILTTIFKSEIPSKKYKQIHVQGKVYDISKEPRSTYYKIDTNWYLIRDECIDYIEIGDSISKKEGSYEFVVYDGISSSIKYRKEVKRLTFEEVEPPK